MKKSKYLLFIILFTMCSSPKIEYKEFNQISDYSKNHFLEKLDAKDISTSVILFTSGFKEDHIKVKNDNEIVLDSILKSDLVLGLATVVKINKSEKVSIEYVGAHFLYILNVKDLKKYKYIYISKENGRKIKYTITYSNSLRGFY